MKFSQSFDLGAFKNKYFSLFLVFFIISIADATSITLGGSNIRLAWGLLPFLLIISPHTKEDKISIYFVIIFFALHIISASNSGNLLTGAAFSIWILVNYFFFFRSGYLLSGLIRENIWHAFIILGRLQIVIGFLMYASGINDRTQFIYYEPSYFAMGLVPYIFCTAFWSENKYLDYGLIILALTTSQSANMAIAVFSSIIFYLIYSRRFLFITTTSCLIPLAIYSTYLMILLNPENPNYGLARWINENGISIDLISEALQRAGNRVPRIEAALEFLKENWLLGVGPGNYTEITKNINFNHITGGAEYLDPAGLPAINVIIESTLNSGIFGALILLLYAFYTMLRVKSSENPRERWLMIGSLCTFFIMLQIESSYLRAYIWFTVGAFLARTPSTPIIRI
jgi:hypothetical protein